MKKFRKVENPMALLVTSENCAVIKVGDVKTVCEAFGVKVCSRDKVAEKVKNYLNKDENSFCVKEVPFSSVSKRVADSNLKIRLI